MSSAGKIRPQKLQSNAQPRQMAKSAKLSVVHCGQNIEPATCAPYAQADWCSRQDGPWQRAQPLPWSGQYESSHVLQVSVSGHASSPHTRCLPAQQIRSRSQQPQLGQTGASSASVHDSYARLFIQKRDRFEATPIRYRRSGPQSNITEINEARALHWYFRAKSSTSFFKVSCNLRRPSSSRFRVRRLSSTSRS